MIDFTRDALVGIIVDVSRVNDGTMGTLGPSSDLRYDLCVGIDGFASNTTKLFTERVEIKNAKGTFVLLEFYLAVRREPLVQCILFIVD